MAMNMTISFSGSEKKLTKAQQRRAEKFDRDAETAMLKESVKAVIQLARRVYS